ncbi:MAG: hypothetical protein M1820_000262 [Bogoriella megaspora]|nr:MAG: hypothetical protein M1820_000262 [Bogoriella megaspora]
MENGTKLPERPIAAKPKKEKPPKQSKAPALLKTKREASIPNDPEAMFKSGFLAEVYQERPLETNGFGKVITRFPPEPNGYLHIGHSKAIAVNFGFAKFHSGEIYLRFDDTNPKGEEERYYKSIEDIVRWLGFRPVKITHSSDSFQRLYDLAEKLILKDGAYVCHCTKEEIKAQRGSDDPLKKGKTRYPCPHRDRPVEESLREFRAMRDGKYRAKEAALRMKQDLANENPQMWDLSAYRVLEEKDGSFAKHFRTGDEWKIYPTYDFTHCLCDSFEGITHSLCTTEFEQSRESYEWLCDALEVYKPMQREYGRLNVNGTILSKRKLIELVEGEPLEKPNIGKYVKGWDDPRLFTLVGLRRRGVPPGAILSFVNEIGVTRAESSIEIKRFEQSIRAYLEASVPRLMLVLNPIAVVIDNLAEDCCEMVELPFSKDPSYGVRIALSRISSQEWKTRANFVVCQVHAVPFTKMVYIDRSDFREVADESFFRLKPGGSVGLLRVPFPITAVSYEKDPATGLITQINAHYDIPDDGKTFKKPKTYIQWVGHSSIHDSPLKVEVHNYNPLFKSDKPGVGFLEDINPDSEEIFPNALIENGFHEIKNRAPWPANPGRDDASTSSGPESVRFQGMRIAYYCEDSTSTPDKLVLNRIVTLKEDAGKG